MNKKNPTEKLESMRFPIKRVRPVAMPEGKSMTQQQFRDETDINKIVSKYHDTGAFPDANKPLNFGDVSTMEDYQTSLNKVMHAEKVFSELKPEIRKEFDNNPKHFLHFMEDANNLERARELGIVERPPSQPIQLSTLIEDAVKTAIKVQPDKDKKSEE